MPRRPGLFEPDEAAQFSEEAEAWSDEPGAARGPGGRRWRPRPASSSVTRRARRRIRVNAKGEALKRALDRLFTVARAHRWPEKAVVFTESRRTQAYLAELLAEHGYAGPDLAALR